MHARTIVFRLILGTAALFVVVGGQKSCAQEALQEDTQAPEQPIASDSQVPEGEEVAQDEDSAAALVANEADPAKTEQIAKLIEQLGDDDYATRERAQADLADFGMAALGQLRVASMHDDLEVRARARFLLRSLTITWIMPNDPPEVKTILERYMQSSAEDRLIAIEQLAQLEDGQGIPALCRLVKFELADRYREAAAVALLWTRPLVQETPAFRSRWNRRKWSAGVQREMADGSQETSDWIRAYVMADMGSKESLDAFAKHVQEFAKRAAKSSGAAKGEAASVVMLDPALSSYGNMVMDDRSRSMGMLYLLADLQRNQGQANEAEATAKIASESFPASDPAGAQVRALLANRLHRRGCVDWAIKEYRLAMEQLPGPMRLVTASALSELLHDQERDAEAEETVLSVIDADAEDVPQGAIGRQGADGLLPMERKQYKARALYFRACAAQAAGDEDAHRKAIEESLDADATDLDSLIARYHLKNTDEAYRKRTDELIEVAADLLRQQHERSRDAPKWANQLAWLLVRTERNLDEADRLSAAAVKATSDNAAYLDTRAHVLCALGRVDEAVKTQEIAVELEPYSKQLQQALDRFESKRVVVPKEGLKSP